MQPKGREFEPRTLHTFLHGTPLLPPLGGALALADSMANVAPTFGVDSPAYVAIRAVMYLAALSIIGSCAFILLIATRVSHLSGSQLEISAVLPATRRLARWATLVLACAMVARLLAQGYMIGEGGTLVLMPLLESTVWGWGWLVGAAATVAMAVALTVKEGSRATWRIAAAGTMALALSFSLTGHATSVSYPAVHVLLDSVHVMAAGGWMGTLFVVATIGLRVGALGSHRGARPRRRGAGQCILHVRASRAWRRSRSRAWLPRGRIFRHSPRCGRRRTDRRSFVSSSSSHSRGSSAFTTGAS